MKRAKPRPKGRSEASSGSASNVIIARRDRTFSLNVEQQRATIVSEEQHRRGIRSGRLCAQ